ncbi:hypothetical protein ACEWY4_017482 [Coilia grayii]|uniref:Ig-like domain-containing protein n=1 Tax=Coilia grayii TaxID=363190 RepID=A0ABD1JGZ0_9TELE
MSAQLGEGQSYNISNARAEHSGHYYCTAENKHGASDSSTTLLNVLYSPRNVSVSPLSDLKDSMTLTCRSDANPAAHGYTWYRETDDGTVVQGTGMSLSLAAGLSGLYHCEAQNQVGSRNSTAVWVFLAVVFENATKLHSDWTVAGGVMGGMIAGFVAGALVGVLVYKRMTQSREARNSSTGAVGGATADPQSADGNSSDGTYTGLDLTATFSEYVNLAAARSNPADDTYTNLNPTTISKDYDTLANVKISAEGAKYKSPQNPTDAAVYEN